MIPSLPSPVLSPLSSLASSSSTLLQSGAATLPPALEIRPGDSAALVRQKIDTFVLATVIEILDALTLPSAAQRELKRSFAEALASRLPSPTAQRQVEGEKVPSQTSAAADTLQRPSTSVAGELAPQLPTTVQPHSLSTKSLQVAELRSVLTNREILQSLSELARGPGVVATPIINLTPLLTSPSLTFSEVNPAVRSEVRELIKTLIAREIGNAASNGTQRLPLSKVEWRGALAALQLFNRLEEVPQLSVGALKLGIGSGPDGESATVQQLRRGESGSVPDRSATASVQRGAAKHALSETRNGMDEAGFAQRLSSNLASVGASVQETLAASQLSQTVVTLLSSGAGAPSSPAAMRHGNDALVSMLAARLVTAYKLSPEMLSAHRSNSSELLGRNRYRQRHRDPSSAWLLRFFTGLEPSPTNSTESQEIAVLLSKDERDGVSAQILGCNNEREQVRWTRRAKNISQRLGFRQIDW